jgi:hypothetical protein
MRLPTLLALALGLATSAPAFAGHRHDRDHDRRSTSWTAPAPAPSTAGAIAYSPSTGAIGWSYGYGTPEDAQAAAVGSCGQADCALQVWERDECAALVVGSNGPSVGWDLDVAGAQTRALEQCSEGGTGCTVQRWVCR